MKIIFLAFLFLALFSKVKAEDIYLKGGGGMFLYSSEFNSSPFGSAAIGIEVVDNLSFFISAEFSEFPYSNFPQSNEISNRIIQFPPLRDWAFMGNLQFEWPLSEIFKPYLFAGMGLDNFNKTPIDWLPNANSFNFVGFQFGLGSDEKIIKNVYVFNELKWHGFAVTGFLQLQAGLKLCL